jgi:hypothetical protein
VATAAATPCLRSRAWWSLRLARNAALEMSSPPAPGAFITVATAATGPATGHRKKETDVIALAPEMLFTAGRADDDDGLASALASASSSEGARMELLASVLGGEQVTGCSCDERSGEGFYRKARGGCAGGFH